MKISDDLYKAGLTAIVGAGASIVLSGELNNKASMLGITLPTPLLIGGAVGASSLVADASHDWVFNHIPKNQKFSNVESALVGLGLSGASTAAILHYGAGAPAENMMNSFILGAGSYAAGDYISQKTSVGVLF